MLKPKTITTVQWQYCDLESGIRIQTSGQEQKKISSLGADSILLMFYDNIFVPMVWIIFLIPSSKSQHSPIISIDMYEISLRSTLQFALALV